MKKLLLSIAFLSFSSLLYADVYVVHKDGVVYSLSEQNDAVIPDGYKTTVLKGGIENLPITRPLDEYTFDGKNFKVNTSVVKAKEDAIIAENAKKAEIEAKKASAIDKLKALGLTTDEISSLTGE